MCSVCISLLYRGLKTGIVFTLVYFDISGNIAGFHSRLGSVFLPEKINFKENRVRYKYNA